MTQGSGGVRVAIVGAGIAGLTAALRLAQRGYKVTVYEEKPYIGGQLGAHKINGIYHEHCHHMYLNWYNNFWKIVEEDLGLTREEYFEPRTNVKYLRKGEFPRFTQLTNVGLPESQLTNLLSGVEPIPDMFLWGYSLIDLISQPFHQSELLSRNSVNGFMSSRFYATSRSAALHQEVLTKAFAVPSYLTSASSYKNFIKYGVRHPDPFLWVLKGNVYGRLISFWEQKLIEYGCTIEREVSVSEVILDDKGKVDKIQLQDTEFVELEDSVRLVGRTLREQQVDYLILAVPSKPLGRLVEVGVKDRRIVDKLPVLAEMRGLDSTPIASFDVYFKKKLAGIPKEHVILRDSGYGLSFIDNSQVWVDDPQMSKFSVLSVAASNFYALASLEPHEDAYYILKRLSEYIPVFNPGKHWGDEESDVDWDKSYFQPNAGDALFINQTGSEMWRPQKTYEGIPNLFFAGDFCMTVIDVITVEGAVVSGLEAAKALQLREPLGDPIEVIEPDAYPESSIIAMKLLMAPYAYAAKWWSMADDAVSLLGRRGSTQGLVSNLMAMYWAPYSVPAEWWETVWSMYKDMWRGGANR